jgi:hypothetical protein
MRDWCDMVVEISDCEPHHSKTTHKICRHIFRYFCINKFKDPKKFEGRRGLEYDTFIESLSEYPKDLVDNILDYDGFLEKTHEVSRKHKSKTNLSKD